MDDKQGHLIQDAVNTLIYSISQHFIGDSSHIRDRNQDLREIWRIQSVCVCVCQFSK